jgi:hypothetical protein
MWSLVPDKYRKDRTLATLYGESILRNKRLKFIRVFHYRKVRRTNRKRGYTDGKTAISFRVKNSQVGEVEFRRDFSSTELWNEEQFHKERSNYIENWLSGVRDLSSYFKVDQLW